VGKDIECDAFILMAVKPRSPPAIVSWCQSPVVYKFPDAGECFNERSAEELAKKFDDTNSHA
jgi:hypothetical protein